MSAVKMRNRQPNTADSNADSTPELKESKKSRRKTAKGRQTGCRWVSCTNTVVSFALNTFLYLTVDFVPILFLRSLLVSRTKRIALLLCTVYISVPVVVYLFPWILGHVIYLHLCKFNSSLHFSLAVGYYCWSGVSSVVINTITLNVQYSVKYCTVNQQLIHSLNLFVEFQ